MNHAPTVATAASATPSVVTGMTTSLSVSGADVDTGEGSLTYTWATTGTPPAAVNFSPNGTYLAKNSTATFSKYGNYTFQVTITDPGGLTATSSVSVAVNQSLTTVVVSPSSVSLNVGAMQQFTATGRDQFVAIMATQPTFNWKTTVGTITPTGGLLTAPATSGSGIVTATATNSTVNGTAAVTVTSQPAFSAYYDFGTATSPVQAGYTQVTEATKYSSTLGYGWQIGTIVSRDRGIGSNLDRDFNYTTNGTFAVNLPNGSYQVNMDLGDTGPYLHDNMGIFLQGTQVDTVSTAAGQVVSKSYTVNVVNGQLDFAAQGPGRRRSERVHRVLVDYDPAAESFADDPNVGLWVHRGDGHEHVFKLGSWRLRLHTSRGKPRHFDHV